MVTASSNISKMLPFPSSVSLSLDTFSRGRRLLLLVLFTVLGRHRQLSQSITLVSRIQLCPVARRCNRRGRAQHDHRGNIQGDGWRLRRSGHAEFSLPRVHAAMSPFGLTQLTFTSQTGSLLLSSLKKVTFPPSSLSPPSVTFSLSPDRPRCSAGTHPPACPRRGSGASGAFAARTAG